MPDRSPDAELTPLCKRAEQLAARRREPLSTVHLLMALSAQPEGAAAGVLDAHRITPARIEALVHTTVEPQAESVARAVRDAHSFAQRTKTAAPTSLHLLHALLGERGCIAYRVLEQAGVDLGRLRTAVMQVAIGATAPRRPSALPSAAPRAAPTGTGVVVRLVPTPLTKASKPAARGRAAAEPVSTSPSDVTLAPPPPPAARPKPAPAPARANAGANAGANAARARPAADDDLARFTLDPKRFPLLSSIGRNLTLAAARGEAAAVIGREAEIERCFDVLAKRHANNPVLVGVAGVGKSAVVRGMAAVSAAARAGSSDERVLVEMTVADLLAGTGVRGALAERFGAVRNEVRGAGGRVVLVFDDAHQLFGGEVEAELGAELRLALARGELPCVGVTTHDEFRRLVDHDPALLRRLCPIEVDEPAPEEAFLICRGVAESLGAHHGLTYDDDAVAAAVEWTGRFLPGRALPEKALSVLDLAGARARRRGDARLTPEAVASVVAEQTDVPVERLLANDQARMLALDQTLAERVVGHRTQLARIAAVLRRNAAGIRGRRPVGTFLLLGPSGVGKTETAKAVAQALFHSPDAMTRLDFSEYAESHAVARLVGAPPGYVGHEAGGQLTEAVRRRPYQVILLDEIEKAHLDVLETFLQVLDEGRLTDGRGRTVDFTNTVLLLTSNLGASAAVSPAGGARIGFGRAAPAARDNTAAVVAAARAFLPAELFNRFDEVLVYSPLTRDDLARVAELQLAALSEALDQNRGVRVRATPGALAVVLASVDDDPTLGARPIKRAIATLIEAPLAEGLLRGDFGEGDRVLVDVDGRGALTLARDDDDDNAAPRACAR